MSFDTQTNYPGKLRIFQASGRYDQVYGSCMHISTRAHSVMGVHVNCHSLKIGIHLRGHCLQELLTRILDARDF